MTAFVAPTALETQFSGQYGNQSVAHGTFNPNGAQINDTVFLLKLYAGTKITGVRLVNGANGAGTTVDVGLSYVDGSAGLSASYFHAGQATAVAGSATSAARPIYLTKDVYVIATFKGAATSAAGAGNFIDVIVDFEFRGA